jgi:hypothetical protein
MEKAQWRGKKLPRPANAAAPASKATPLRFETVGVFNFMR